MGIWSSSQMLSQTHDHEPLGALAWVSLHLQGLSRNVHLLEGDENLGMLHLVWESVM